MDSFVIRTYGRTELAQILDQQELMKEPQNEKQKEGHPGFQFL